MCIENTPLLRIFHSYGNITIEGEGLQIAAYDLWSGRDLYRAIPAYAYAGKSKMDKKKVVQFKFTLFLRKRTTEWRDSEWHSWERFSILLADSKNRPIGQLKLSYYMYMSAYLWLFQYFCCKYVLFIPLIIMYIWRGWNWQSYVKKMYEFCI